MSKNPKVLADILIRKMKAGRATNFGELVIGRAGKPLDHYDGSAFSHRIIPSFMGLQGGDFTRGKHTGQPGFRSMATATGPNTTNGSDGKQHILRPLSPHLPLYKPQLSSTSSISNRISGAFLTANVLAFYLLCLKTGPICLTFENFYQFLFYSSKLTLVSAEIAALALSYHVYAGIRHLSTDFSSFSFLRIRQPRH